MPGAKSDWQLRYVRAEDVEAVWPIAAPFVQRAIDKVPTDLTLDQVREWSKDGRLRLWIVSDGDEPVAAFPVAELPDGTVEFYAISGRRMTEWLPVLLPLFASMAKSAGKRALRLDGRFGWERRMAPFGFTTIRREGRTVTMDMVL